MSKYRADNVPKKADPAKKAEWYLTLIELAAKGISNRSIAARLGFTLDEFYNIVEYEQNGRRPVREALDLARAQFEIERVEVKDAILNDPETSKGLKYKIVREDLKTLEEWAPASRAVKVQVESGPTEFSFEAFSESELAAIAQASAESDNKNIDGKDENTTD